MDEVREELAELRTCSSIIGLSCVRILKKHVSSLNNPELLRYILILNNTLQRLELHIKKLEDLARGECGDGTETDQRSREES